MGKVEAYAIDAAGFTNTPCGLLLGHVVLGCLMLERRLAALRAPVCSEGQLLDLQHMILSHHGALEFGSPVQPMTTEAEIVHWADEASAKANDMMESIDDPSHFIGGAQFSDKRAWRVGRRIWRRPDGTCRTPLSTTCSALGRRGRGPPDEAPRAGQGQGFLRE